MSRYKYFYNVNSYSSGKNSSIKKSLVSRRPLKVVYQWSSDKSPVTCLEPHLGNWSHWISSKPKSILYWYSNNKTVRLSIGRDLHKHFFYLQQPSAPRMYLSGQLNLPRACGDAPIAMSRLCKTQCLLSEMFIWNQSRWQGERIPYRIELAYIAMTTHASRCLLKGNRYGLSSHDTLIYS